MTTLKTKLAVMAASALALAATAQAQNVTTSGFALASWSQTNGTGADHFGIDNAMIKFSGDYKPLAVVASLYYVPGSAVGTDSDIHFLDAYATYDMGGGWAVTGGRFLSWMGYESFFSVNNPEMTPGYLNPVIGGYEEGARVVYTDKDWNAGLALTDSVLHTASAFYGDGELKKGYGAEAYFNYTGIKDTQIWFGISHDSKGATASDDTTFDLWAQYQIDPALYVAFDLAVFDGVADSTSWLVLADYTFSDKIAAAFRVGGDRNNGPTAADDTKYTFAPTYTVTKNFSVRGEVSYTVFNGAAAPNTTFLGLQGVFKF